MLEICDEEISQLSSLAALASAVKFTELRLCLAQLPLQVEHPYKSST